jgi:hypothetical protein
MRLSKEVLAWFYRGPAQHRGVQVIVGRGIARHSTSAGPMLISRRQLICRLAALVIKARPTLAAQQELGG